ncbi:MAG: hypothetical protein H8F28_15630 [Fibrella sp.]|nr:hypothetical protein [Armatimonadota bacterium]
MSSLLDSKPNTKTGLISLTTGWSLVAVRDALRSGDRAKIDRAVTPLYNRCVVPLSRFASNLLRKGEAIGLSVGKDGEDIAVEAFDKVFTVIVGDNGDRILDEVHFLRTLFRAARCVWVDALRLPDTRQSRPRSDRLERDSEPESPAPTPDEEIFGAGKTALVVLRLLFTDGERLGRLLRKSGAGTRHFRQYQALALYELGERLRDDLEGATREAETVVLRFWRQLSVETICIRARDWVLVETASGSCINTLPDVQTYLYEPIRIAVEVVVGADLQNRAKRYILRHEMGRLLTERGAEIETIGRE